MSRMTGSRALAEVLRAEGVRYVFGNPGTTEMPFLDALQDVKEVQYVTTLFEGVAAGMADGYARITRKPSVMNLHISVGVANSIAVMYNSWRGGTPMVITAGQSALRLQLHSPTLYSNMVNVMREYTKWAAEVTTAEDVPAILRRAFKVASTPPTGPVFVSLTWDAMTEEADVDLVPATYGYFRVRPDPDAVREATRLLSAARRPLIVVGDRVSQSEGAPRLVAAVAEQLGAPVYATSFSEVHIPSSHPHFLGVFNTSWFHRTMKQRFDAADAILAVGTEMMTQSIPTPEPPIAGPVRLIHLDSSDWAIQRSYPVTVGLLGDIAVALGELSAALGAAMSASQKEAARRRGAAVAAERRARQEAFEAVAREHWDDQPMSPERLAVELRESLPADALVCDDAITVSNTLLEAIPFDAPGALIGSRGGSVGVGMGAALGMKLAAPDRPVVAVIGDGTAMYAIQALWTAASYRIPVTYVMCNNRSYKVLRENMTRYLTGSPRRSEYVGMDFYRLPLDFVKLAAAFEVPGIRVERPEELAPAVRRGLTSRGPLVIDAILDDSFDGAEIQKRWAEWWNA